MCIYYCIYSFFLVHMSSHFQLIPFACACKCVHIRMFLNVGVSAHIVWPYLVRHFCTATIQMNRQPSRHIHFGKVIYSTWDSHFSYINFYLWTNIEHKFKLLMRKQNILSSTVWNRVCVCVKFGRKRTDCQFVLTLGILLCWYTSI